MLAHDKRNMMSFIVNTETCSIVTKETDIVEEILKLKFLLSKLL